MVFDLSHLFVSVLPSETVEGLLKNKNRKINSEK